MSLETMSPSAMGTSSYEVVYLDNNNAYLKQETSEIVVTSILQGGFLFIFNIINLKSREIKER